MYTVKYDCVEASKLLTTKSKIFNTLKDAMDFARIVRYNSIVIGNPTILETRKEK